MSQKIEDTDDTRTPGGFEDWMDFMLTIGQVHFLIQLANDGAVDVEAEADGAGNLQDWVQKREPTLDAVYAGLTEEAQHKEALIQSVEELILMRMLVVHDDAPLLRVTIGGLYAIGYSKGVIDAWGKKPESAVEPAGQFATAEEIAAAMGCSVAEIEARAEREGWPYHLETAPDVPLVKVEPRKQ